MPSLNTFKYVHGYGKSGLVTEAAPAVLDSVDGTQDAYLVKYDADGKAKWAARVGGTGAEIGYSIYNDPSNNVYLTGEFGGAAVSFYNADGTYFNQVLNSGNLDAFVVKYNSNGVAQWCTRIAGTGADSGIAIVCDSSSNVYVTGSYTGTVTIFNFDKTAFGTLSNSGGTDIFVAKYDTNGMAQWATRISTANTDVGRGIAVDTNDNVLVTGSYNNTATVFNADGSTFGTLAISGNLDVFVVKYNSSGAVQWTTRIASSGSDAGFSIVCDSSDNVIVCGQISPTATVFSSDGSTFGTITSSVTTAFVVKYNSSGIAQWRARIDASSSDQSRGVACDSSGNIYMTGLYSGGTATVFNFDGTTFGTLANSGSNDAFLVKYNSSGTVQWATRIASSNSDVGYGIAIDSASNVYVTGQFSGTTFLGTVTIFNAGGSTFGTLSLNNVSTTAAFLVKYNSNGVVQWATRIVSSSTIVGFAVSIDTTGNIYASGHFVGGRLTIYGNTLSLFSSLPKVNDADVFAVKYNTNGEPQWTARIGSTLVDTVFSTTTDSSGNMYVGGTSTGTITIYNSDDSVFGTRSNVSNTAGFLVKYNSSGFAQWATRLTGNSSSTIYGIATDSSGNVFVTGQFLHTTMTIWNSDDTSFGTVANSGSGDGFIIKYDASGVVQWVSTITGTGAESGNSIAVDSAGDIYVIGTTGNGTTTNVLNSDGTTFGTIANGGNTDAFLVKYDTSGFAQWTTRLAGTSTDIGYSVITDNSNNVFMSGAYTTTPTIFNSDGSTFGTLGAVSAREAFLVKYNSSGFVQWATRLAGTGATNEEGFACTTDSDGNVFIGGNGTPIAYNSDGSVFRTPLTGPAFLVKYNSSGFGQWMINYTSTSGGSIRSISTDSDKNVYVSGRIGLASINLAITNSDGSVFGNVTGDVSAIKFDKDGFVQWVQTIRNVSTSTAGTSLFSSITPQGDLTVVGTSVSASTSLVQIYNRNQTPYKFLNTVSAQDTYVIKYSPTVVPQWASLVSGVSEDTGLSIITDSSGDVYVSGQSTGAITVYNVDGSVFGTLPNSGGSDAFLVKYNSSGFVQWTARIASIGTDSGNSVAVDTSGNVYVIGLFTGTATAYNSDGTSFGTTLTHSGLGDAFLVKYNASGITQWITRVASTATDRGNRIVIDTNNNIYITGRYTGTGTAYNSDGTPFATTLSQIGADDAYLVEYDTNGFVQWITRLGSTGGDAGYGIGTDLSGNVYLGGTFGTTGFTAYNADGTAFGTTLSSSGGSDAFLVKYSSTGVVQWIARVGSTATDEGVTLAIDTSGNVYLCGTYQNTITIVNSNGTTFGTMNVTSGAAGDAFVVKYNTDGVGQWSTKIGGAVLNVFDIGNGIAVDSTGSVYVAGRSNGTVPLAVYNTDQTVFGTTLTEIPTVKGQESFIVKYNSSGAVQWLSSIGGFGNDEAQGITIDSTGNIYVTGMFNASGLVPVDV